MYVEPPVKDKNFVELLRKYHDHTDNFLINIFKKYNRLAALITRRYCSSIRSSYIWQCSKKVDFMALASNTAAVADNIWKLYDYINKSREVDKLNESLEYRHLSINFHLVLIVNLIVQDYNNRML